MNIPRPILLYDGPCTLCQRSVRFILKREKASVLSFASLQSEVGRELQQKYALPDDLDAVVLVKEEGITWGSDAAFRICAYLKAPWSWFHPWRHLPSAPFQAMYRFVAKRRTKWFGREENDACQIPAPGQADRFLG